MESSKRAVSTPEVDNRLSDIAGVLGGFVPYDETTYKALVELAEEMRVKLGVERHEHPNIAGWVEFVSSEEDRSAA